MLKLFSAKKPINLVIDDYCIRMADPPEGRGLPVKKLKEKAVPVGLVEHGRIVDELEFFNFFRQTMREWGVKNRFVRFYAPDSLVIMKRVTYPSDLKTKEEILAYFNMELGRTLYLPFENPIFDIHPLKRKKGSSEQDEEEGILFAVPEEEIRKLVDLLTDCHLRPMAVDVRPIGVYRYFAFQYEEAFSDQAFLFMEVNLSSVSISIFYKHTMEFLRFLELDISPKDWVLTSPVEGQLKWTYQGDKERLDGILQDQIIELERIMSFYRFSVHKGEREISKLVLLGDYPELESYCEKIAEQLGVSVMLLNAIGRYNVIIPRSFIPAIGLSLKGDKK